MERTLADLSMHSSAWLARVMITILIYVTVIRVIRTFKYFPLDLLLSWTSLEGEEMNKEERQKWRKEEQLDAGLEAKMV